MKEAGDIVSLTFPFAAGAALAQYCFASLPVFSQPLMPGVLLIVLCALILLILEERLRKRLWVILMFFILGAFCGLAGLPQFLVADEGELASSGGGRSIFRVALGRIVGLLRSIPFSHEGTGALLQALLTGQRDALPLETSAAFRAAGASHILALSGLHLGIIYMLLGRILSFLGNGRAMMPVRSVLIVAACAFYTLMTGAGPSIVRAMLFISINELMRFFPGRKKSPLSVWCCALMIQLIISPWVIRSVGFQLSYLAMLGIFTVFPVLDGWYDGSAPESACQSRNAVGNCVEMPGADHRRKGLLRWIWSSMALSVSCQLFTAPLVWLAFGSFPKYFLLTNLLALPLVSILMPLAVVTAVLFASGVCPELLVWLTDAVAGLLLAVISLIAGM